MGPRTRPFRPRVKPRRSLGLRLQPLQRTRPPRYPNDRPKTLRGTVRPRGAMRRPRPDKPRHRRPAQHLHPPPRRRERSLRRRRHRLPILMRDTTCRRWPIMTWKACDRALHRATGIIREKLPPRRDVPIIRKERPHCPPSPAGRRCPGAVQEPRAKTKPTRGVPSIGRRSDARSFRFECA